MIITMVSFFMGEINAMHKKGVIEFFKTVFNEFVKKKL